MSYTFRNSNIVSTIKCAGPGCQKTRAAADPWFVTVIARDVFTCRRFAPSRPLRRFEQPVCGQACAVRLFDGYLSGTQSSSSRTDPSVTSRKPINTAVIAPRERRSSREPHAVEATF